MKKVLITGITGQDGAYLAQKLLNKNYIVYGTIRRGGSPKTQRLKKLGIINKINFVTVELMEFANVFSTLRELQPDYIYNLAAQSFVADSFVHPILTSNTNYIGVLNILESIRILKLDCNLYHASTSEMFGEVLQTPQSEKTPFNPISPYAISKLAAHYSIINYRESFNINCSSGILFNHESELRGAEFVTRKISLWISQLHKGIWGPIPLGNLSSKRDWGYAPEYVESMIKICESEKKNEYVVATNTQASIRDFLKWCCEYLDYEIEFIGEGIDEKCIDKKNSNIIAYVDKKYFRENDVNSLKGDYTKIKNELGWEPKTFAKEIAQKMIKYDLENDWNDS
jgi:GDPmannose 4,6-dehydratase